MISLSGRPSYFSVLKSLLLTYDLSNPSQKLDDHFWPRPERGFGLIYYIRPSSLSLSPGSFHLYQVNERQLKRKKH